MGSDLFGSLAESLCAALVVSSSSWNLISTNDAIYFPIVVVCAGIVASFLTQWLIYLPKIGVELKLRIQLIISTCMVTLLIVPCIYMLPT
jgi:inorganic pyrophosphatase